MKLRPPNKLNKRMLSDYDTRDTMSRFLDWLSPFEDHTESSETPKPLLFEIPSILIGIVLRALLITASAMLCVLLVSTPAILVGYHLGLPFGIIVLTVTIVSIELLVYYFKRRREAIYSRNLEQNLKYSSTSSLRDTAPTPGWVRSFVYQHGKSSQEN
jgi:hypothetical protein